VAGYGRQTVDPRRPRGGKRHEQGDNRKRHLLAERSSGVCHDGPHNETLSVRSRDLPHRGGHRSNWM